MNARGYSEAVYKALQKGVTIADALRRLQGILARHGHSALYARILESLKARLARDLKKNIAEVRIARKDDAKKYRKEIEAFLKAERVEDSGTIIDESLIGGYVLEGRGKRVDASYKKSLLSIYQSLIANQKLITNNQ